MPLLAPLCTSLLHAPVPTLRPADCTTARRSAHPACRPMAPTLSPGACCLALSAPCLSSHGAYTQPGCLLPGTQRTPAAGVPVFSWSTPTSGTWTLETTHAHAGNTYVLHTYTWNANSRAVHAICMQRPTVECVRTTHSEVVDQCVWRGKRENGECY